MTFGTWLVSGTPVDQPYPCRCHERLYSDCSAAFCPCAGRLDPPNSRCCANWFGPAQHMAAMAEWRAKKLREQAGLDKGSN